MRTLIRAGTHIGACAVGLIVAAVLLDRVDLGFTGFIVAVVIFAVLQVLLGWVIDRVTLERAPALSSLAGLFTTFAALVITNLVSDGISISGVGTWIIATVIVWLAILVASFALPPLLRRGGLDDRRPR